MQVRILSKSFYLIVLFTLLFLVPMCGIPLHTVETYIGKLIQKGQMVAVCEQISEDNKPTGSFRTRRKQKNPSPLSKVVGGSGGVVKREITRLVSPGTLIEDHLLQPRTNNYLASIYYNIGTDDNPGNIGLTWLDISTGDFHYTSIPSSQELKAELYRIQPAEIICSYRLKAGVVLGSYSILSDAISSVDSDELLQKKIKELSKTSLKEEERRIMNCLSDYRVTPRIESNFETESARNGFLQTFQTQNINDIVASISSEELCAAGGLLQYISQTQRGVLPSLSKPQKHIINNVMHIDASTFQCLELVQSTTPDSSKTLL